MSNRTPVPPQAMNDLDPTLTITVTASTVKEWTLSIPIATIRQTIEEIKKESGMMTTFSPVYTLQVLERIREQGGELAESIPDPGPWQEYSAEPFKIHNSLLLQIEEVWHENNDD